MTKIMRSIQFNPINYLLDYTPSLWPHHLEIKSFYYFNNNAKVHGTIGNVIIIETPKPLFIAT